MRFVNDLNQRGITVKLYNEEELLSTCTISVSNGIWSITEWFTSSNHKQKGYGNQVMTEAFRLLYESYGRPNEIRYNWNGVNAYVFEWLQKHFSPTSLLPIAEQKYMQDDCWEAHIYILDRDKVLNYFLKDQ